MTAFRRKRRNSYSTPVKNKGRVHRWLYLALHLASISFAILLLLAYLGTASAASSSTWLMLASLAYPYLVVGNVLCLLLWVMLGSKYFWIPTICMALGWKFMLSYAAFCIGTTTTTDRTSPHLKLLSNNVQLFGWYNWQRNRKDSNQLLAMLDSADADVYCFQEFFHHSDGLTFETRHQLIKQLETPYLYEAEVSLVNQHEHYGIATLSKFPIIRGGRLRFRSGNGNSCIFSDLVWHGDTLRIYNAHMSSIRFNAGDYAFMKALLRAELPWSALTAGVKSISDKLLLAAHNRSQQVEQLLMHASMSPYPVVICGDFNDTPTSYFYTVMRAYYSDAFLKSGCGLGLTYWGAMPPFRIDYIFHSPEIGSSNFVIYTKNVSDHKAISCDLYW